MTTNSDSVKNYVAAISQSNLTIYSPIEVGDPNLWIPTPELESLLDAGLRGWSVYGLPNRTRSKVIKQKICAVLGYPVPKSFKKTKPQFPGQLFDTYSQKANNLQVYNEEIYPARRYVVIGISAAGIVYKVKVIAGDDLARLDTTGKLTQKYQARLKLGQNTTELVSHEDTDNLRRLILPRQNLTQFTISPISYPTSETLLPISVIFDRLAGLIGQTFDRLGYDQERNRGAALHRMVCRHLGYASYQDGGRFPDIRNQLLEVKLQTSPTIDLGAIRPDSAEPLDVPQINGQQIRHCDVRYAVFYAAKDGTTLTLTHFFLTTGQDFFSRFAQFQGNVLNKNLNIPLPSTFFD